GPDSRRPRSRRSRAIDRPVAPGAGDADRPRRGRRPAGARRHAAARPDAGDRLGGRGRPMTTSTENASSEGGGRRVFGHRNRGLAAPRQPLRARLRLPLMLAGPIVVAVAASWWYLTSGRYVSTDDAYVQAARTMISSDVAGRVIAVEVHDNQRVTAGQVLFRLDPKSYQIAVNDAVAQLGVARLQVQALKAT